MTSSGQSLDDWLLLLVVDLKVPELAIINVLFRRSCRLKVLVTFLESTLPKRAYGCGWRSSWFMLRWWLNSWLRLRWWLNSWLSRRLNWWLNSRLLRPGVPKVLNFLP